MRLLAILGLLAAGPLTHLTVRLDDYSRGTVAGRAVLTQRGPDVRIRIVLERPPAGGLVHYRLYRRHAAHTVVSCETFYDHVGTSFDPSDPTPADAELPVDRDLHGTAALIRNTTIAKLRVRDGVITAWTGHDVICGDL